MVALLANLLAVLSLVSSPAHGAAGHHRMPPAVSMHVAAGYSEQFRASAWTPVRITLRNRTSGTINGTASVSDNSNNNQGPPLPYHAQYEAAVVLPAGATKRVTLYVPGYDIQGEVDARFSRPGSPAVTGSDYITGFGNEVISIGTFSNDPINTSWLNRINQNTSLAVVNLNAATVDPVPEVLGSFDVIVLSNVDASQLDHDQLGALEQYVRDGGALMLIGGPDWQETLHPLPAALIPGRLAGTRTVSSLQGLRAPGTGGGLATKSPTAISVLTHPRGTVLASEDGIPLVVRDHVGSGQIEYLAFDPELDPIAHWPAGGSLLQHLITGAAPLAANRAAQPSNGPPMGPYGKFFGDPFGISSELANLPSAALPSLILFVILTVLFVLIIGPANFLLLRRLRRRELMWLTVPSLALLCVGSTFAIAFHLKGSTVELNTVGAVSLDGSGPHAATFYVGLFAPVRGDYHLTYNAPSLPSAIPQFNSYSPGPQHNPLGLRFNEGNRTGVTFISMNMWSMRTVAIHTRLSLPGAIGASLHLDSAGDIVGAIHNGFHFPVVHPVIVAGAKVVRLADVPAQGTLHVKIRPSVNVYADNQNRGPMGMALYGSPRYGGGYYGGGYYGGGPMGVPFFGGGGCCPGPTPPAEKTVLDRVRNVSMMLPETQQLMAEDEIMLIGWTQQPLGAFDVDGATPRQRELTMLSMPLHVGFPHRAFRLRSGTIGARLVDDVPRQPVNSNRCCGFGQPIYIGSGGSGIFEFDLPDHHARFSRLTLWLNAGGALGDNIGHIYDWHAHRWVHVNLSTGAATLQNPNRFISPWGAFQLRLNANFNSGDITILNLNHDLQLTGQAVQG